MYCQVAPFLVHTCVSEMPSSLFKIIREIEIATTATTEFLKSFIEITPHKARLIFLVDTSDRTYLVICKKAIKKCGLFFFFLCCWVLQAAM